jgi:hypothetical protein
MKTGFKAFVLTATVFALASAGAHAQNQTSTTIALTATVGSFDNITCTQTTVDLNGGVTITAGSILTPGQAINCSVSSNDSIPDNVTAYISTPLTGTANSSDTIPGGAIEWSVTNAGFTPFTAISGNIVGGSTFTGFGAQVATAVAAGANTPVNFFLALQVPAGQAADTYNGTLTVAITPAEV